MAELRHPRGMKSGLQCGGGRSRGRRLRSLRPRQPAEELSRARARRGQHWQLATARPHHQDRIKPRPTAPDRSRVALSPSAPTRRHAQAPPGRPRPARDRDRMESPATAAPPCARLDSERAKRTVVIAVAVARQLAGSCWAIVIANLGHSPPDWCRATMRTANHDTRLRRRNPPRPNARECP
jgi:hypothetical protein